ncbi:MAG: hypothetical protein FWG15_02750 [Propionibacteriaceae bacterium]|nr:hypothetical protein [Propionibacteriaceae bacterium]
MENPLALIPARARQAVYLTALIVGVAGPMILSNLEGWTATGVSVLIAVMALFANAQALSIITPDENNQAIQEHLARRAIHDNEGNPEYAD